MTNIGKGGYLILQCFLMLVSPLSSLVVALIFHRNWISHLFMLIFVAYFGSRFYLGNDATNHYLDMMIWYRGHSLDEILKNRVVFLESREPYSIILKYIVSHITTSPQFFGAVIAVVYAIIVMFTCFQLRKFAIDPETGDRHHSMVAMMIFLTTMTIVQFFWYQSVRYWPGVFFFTGFYLHYVRTRKPWSLIVACMCPIFHFSLFVLPFALLLHALFGKMGYWAYLAFFMISWLFRSIGFDVVPYIQTVIPNFATPEGIADGAEFREYLINYMAEIRSERNIVYTYRTTLHLFFGTALYFIGSICKLKYSRYTKTFFLLAVVLMSISNIEFADNTFYDRFSKTSALFLWISLTTLAYDNVSFCKRKALTMIFILLPVLFFTLATQLTEVRRTFFVAELWFGNFFTDYWGGLDEVRLKFSWLALFLL